VLFNSKFVGYIYIPLPNLNSDDVVMSREKFKFSLTPFCKRQGVTIPQILSLLLQEKKFTTRRPSTSVRLLAIAKNSPLSESIYIEKWKILSKSLLTTFGASYASSRILSFIMLDIKENQFYLQKICFFWWINGNITLSVYGNVIFMYGLTHEWSI